ncbi:hypothetical protein AB6806_15620 [Bosea sp. RCC_152_1]|uniref:hypothetical protein n=1 Tax=Bosea sp. RCC_152_1 TaxID=3239228 RepID=UPI003524C74B
MDEARLRVTQEAFEAFLSDVAFMSKSRKLPTVLFGRTGAIQDAWIVCSDQINVPVLEIGYYAKDRALDFARARLNVAVPNNPHAEACSRAVSLLLDGLRKDTTQDGDRFAGYAPVIQAVADRVAASGNPSTLIAQLQKGEHPVTLQSVVDAILSREHQKLSSIVLEEKRIAEQLYLPKEQLSRLGARVYGGIAPQLIQMCAQDTQTYSSALETWVPEHPFLDGNNRPSSAVFAAVIAAAALQNESIAAKALAAELAKGAASNPFLSEFYFSGRDSSFLPPEHVGIVYSSIRARLSLGDSASLLVDGSDDGSDEGLLRAEIEIGTVRADGTNNRVLRFSSEQAGTLKLGSHVQDVEINAPHAQVEIGGAKEVVLVAPVVIQGGVLSIAAEKVVLEAIPNSSDAAVFIEAQQANVSLISSVPILNGVSLSVAWPGSSAHPWTNFSTNPTESSDPRLEEALRRFRKFVISFRSHSKGSLKRFKDKLDHERMTKGSGRSVLDHMMKTGVVTLDGEMYTLHPQELTRQADASYLSCMARRFSDGTIRFVTEAIS